MVIHAKQALRELSYQAANPFASVRIRDWLFIVGLEGIDESFPVREIATLGSYPFGAAEFDEFLDYLDFPVEYISEHTSHLVLGHSGWSETELLGLLRSRSGKELRVYSQEMFLAYLITWLDPLEGGEDLLNEFSQGHAGLEYLKGIGFDWPSTRIVSKHRFSDINWLGLWAPEKGLLKSMGYKVGKGSWLSDSQRHRILDRILNGEILISGLSPSYIAEWGEPRSPQRLQKMANSIAAFSRNGQMNRNRDMSQAVRDWNADLEYLKQTYYFPLGFQFRWPDTLV